MSFLTSRTAAFSSSARRTASLLSSSSSTTTIRTAARPFHVSGIRSALSELDHDQDTTDRRQAIDEHKNDQLKQQQEGKGQWKKELSSNSEAAVKADRGEIHKGDIETLQQESSKKMEEEHEHGKK